MSVHFAPVESRNLADIVRLERLAFAAKLRLARAVLGCSQSDLAAAVGLTQRSIHKLEKGETEPRRATVHAIEQYWFDHGLEFEELADGGFRVSVRSALLVGQEPSMRREDDAQMLHGESSGPGMGAAYRA